MAFVIFIFISKTARCLSGIATNETNAQILFWLNTYIFLYDIDRILRVHTIAWFPKRI